MKKKFIMFLVALGIVLSAAVFIIYRNENIFKSLLPFLDAEYYSLGETILIAGFSFPFSLIGKLLTVLAESGDIGNGFAFAIFALISLLPLIPVLKTFRIKEKGLRNFILILMCPLTGLVLYAFCNTSFLSAVSSAISNDLNENVKAVFGAAVWSGIVCVVLTEIVNRIKSAKGTQILQFTKMAGLFLSVFLTFTVSVFEVGEFFSNLDIGRGLAEGYVSILCLVNNSLQYILDIAVISSGITLIDSISDGKNSDEIRYFAHRLSNRSITALLTIITVSFLYNFIQIILSPVVFSDVFVKIDIPVYSICFVLMILLISKLVTENKKLEEDNDLFI